MRNCLITVMALVLAGTVFCGFAYADDGQTDGSNPSSGGGLVAGDAGKGGTAQEQAKAEIERKAKLARKTISDGLYNIALKSSKKLSLSVKGASARKGAQAVVSSRDTSDWAQKWAVSWDADAGYYRIRNLNSRNCLGISGAIKSGTAVKQVKHSNSARQFWEPVKVNGAIAFKLAGSQLALTVGGSRAGASFKLQSLKSSAAATQRFSLGKVRALEADKTYFVRNVATGKRLNVVGGSTKANAKLGFAKASSVKSQKFRVVKSGSSAFGLQNAGSCYYIGSGAKGKGAVRQLKSKSAKTKWKIKLDLKAAAFTISSGKSGRCIDGAKGKLRLSKSAGASAQLFTFSRTYAFRLFLDPGHGANSDGNGSWDPGAIGNGHQEAELTHDLCRRVESLLANSDVEVINGAQYRLAYWRRLPKAASLGCDASVSVHFDAGGGSGTLRMVGGQGRAHGSDALASFVQAGVVSKLGLPNRGRSVRGDITVVNGSIPSMLVEVCFIDNAHDARTYLRKRSAVAKGLAGGIMKASRSRAVVVR